MIKRLFFTILFVPVFPMAKYRVKYVMPSRFLSRKLAPHV